MAGNRVVQELGERVAQQLSVAGWMVTEQRVPTADLQRLIDELGPIAAGRGGTRNLLGFAAIQALARMPAVREVAEAVLGVECFAVRGILFDKTPGANWKVMWHQDLTIAVKAARDVAGYGPWSEKDGVPHVQPPVEVLQRMLAVRVHLDDCRAENGPVRVIPGSHRAGKLTPEEIDDWKARVKAVECAVDQGGILAFHPLLLHASSPAISPHHRRVVHLEFAAGELAGGLEWQRRIE